jgi:hypothetical protein
MPWVTREIPPGSGHWRCVNEPARPHPGAAPPFDCADCGRRIGKARLHFVTDDDGVICMRCRERRDPQWNQKLHAGTRAGIAAPPRIVAIPTDPMSAGRGTGRDVIRTISPRTRPVDISLSGRFWKSEA